MNVRVWVTTELAVKQNRVSLLVVSDGPSSPLSAAGQVVCPRGSGWALELAGQSKLSGPAVSHQLGQRTRQVRSFGSTHLGTVTEQLPTRMVVVARRNLFPHPLHASRPHPSHAIWPETVRRKGVVESAHILRLHI